MVINKLVRYKAKIKTALPFPYFNINQLGKIIDNVIHITN